MTPLLTKKQVAEYLRVSTRTIDALCARRQLRFSRVGSRKRFDLRDIEAYVASRSFGHPVSDQPRMVS